MMKFAALLAAPFALSYGLAAHALPAAAVACGGIGADERAALAARAQGANLELELAVARHGDYVAGADVTLIPLPPAAHGGAVHIAADGPVCYARLAPGHYRIEATLHGTTRIAQATVTEGAAEPVRVAIEFPAAAAPGDLDIRPTPEEKQEARTP